MSAPELEAGGTMVFSIRHIDNEVAESALVADCSMHRHSAEYARLFASSRDMLDALQEVLATPGLQSGLQAMCAAAIAKATGRDVADVIKGV